MVAEDDPSEGKPPPLHVQRIKSPGSQMVFRYRTGCSGDRSVTCCLPISTIREARGGCVQVRVLVLLVRVELGRRSAVAAPAAG
jgi:hypothetical protein